MIQKEITSLYYDGNSLFLMIPAQNSDPGRPQHMLGEPHWVSIAVRHYLFTFICVCYCVCVTVCLPSCGCGCQSTAFQFIKRDEIVCVCLKCRRRKWEELTPFCLNHDTKTLLAAVIWAVSGMAPVPFGSSIPGLLNFIRLVFNELKKNFTSQSYWLTINSESVY